MSPIILSRVKLENKITKIRKELNGCGSDYTRAKKLKRKLLALSTKQAHIKRRKIYKLAKASNHNPNFIKKILELIWNI